MSKDNSLSNAEFQRHYNNGASSGANDAKTDSDTAGCIGRQLFGGSTSSRPSSSQPEAREAWDKGHADGYKEACKK